MLYAITRTSSDSNDGKPCDEAIRGVVTETECFAVPSSYDLPPLKSQPHVYYGEKWLEKGFNHRSDGKRIFRDFQVERWCVEINTLEELAAFAKKHGEIVFDGDSIEIFDGYRD